MVIRRAGRTVRIGSRRREAEVPLRQREIAVTLQQAWWRSMQKAPMMMSAVLRMVMPSSLSLR
jgi:hypothetical protein